MAAPSLASTFDSASRRGAPRYPIDVLLDVVALRSGVPNNMPGRCTDLSETGLGAVIAGELAAGQAVAIELRLPNVGLPVRARAQVRYQDRLRCGLQFVGLSIEQREKIHYWAGRRGARVVPAESPRVEVPAADPPAAVAAEKEKSSGKFSVRRRRLLALIGLVTTLVVVGWWQWEKGWNELEADESLAADEQSSQPLRVPPETMDRQITYKVDPVYPDAARKAGTQGFVILNAVIAPDGSVERLRPVAGPEVLAQSAIDAVKSWKYAPYRVEGRPVEVETTVNVDFRLR